MEIKKIIEKYIFKKRYVFYIEKDNFNYNKLPKDKKEVRIEFFDFKNKSKEELIHLMKQIIPENRLIRYVNRYDRNDDWKLVIAYYNNVPAGCLWILDIMQNNFIFDSFVHDKDQVLISGSYVNNKFRGNSIHNLMKKHAIKYVFNKYEDKKIIAIVEKSNISSVRSNKKLAVRIYGMNYLIKFLGKNIFSVFISNDNKLKIWFLKRYRQTHY